MIVKWIEKGDHETIQKFRGDGWQIAEVGGYHGQFSVLASKGEVNEMNAINRFEVLEDAKASVTDREDHYGSPEKNYERVAAIMNVILGDKLRPGHSISAADAIMCVGIAPKLSRIIQSPDHNDSHVDLAGYAALLSEVV